MIQNKICVAPHQIFDYDLDIQEVGHNGAEEYIRKDALLGVIVTAREAAVIQKNFNNCPAEQEVRIDVYDYIMNKIESL